jgi:hypothetical protein
MDRSTVTVSGLLTATIFTPDPDAVVIENMDWDGRWTRVEAGLWVTAPQLHNAFVNSGLSNMLDRWASGTGTSPTRLAVSSDSTAVTGATTTFGGTFRSSAFNATFPSGGPGLTRSFQSDFVKGAAANQIDFPVRKIGLTTASADTASAVQDIIGGAGVAPYNESITIDLTAATSFTFRPQIDVSLAAV